MSKCYSNPTMHVALAMRTSSSSYRNVTCFSHDIGDKVLAWRVNNNHSLTHSNQWLMSVDMNMQKRVISLIHLYNLLASETFYYCRTGVILTQFHKQYLVNFIYKVMSIVYFCDLWQISGFFLVFQFPPLIKLTATT